MNKEINKSDITESKIPGIGYVIALIGLAALVTLMLVPIASVFNSSDVLSRWTIFFNYVVTYSIVLFVSMKIWNVKRFDFKHISLVTVFLLLPLVLSMLLLSEFVVSFIPMPERFAKMFEDFIQLNFQGYLTVGIAAPLLEEFIFRGVILKSFLKKFTPQKAVFWSAFLFGLFHMNPWQFLPALFIGLVIGWLYYKTKSILPGLFIHFANNSISFFIALRYKDINMGAKDLMPSNSAYAMLLVSALAVFLLVVYFLRKHLDKVKSD